MIIAKETSTSGKSALVFPSRVDVKNSSLKAKDEQRMTARSYGHMAGEVELETQANHCGSSAQRRQPCI